MGTAEEVYMKCVEKIRTSAQCVGANVRSVRCCCYNRKVGLGNGSQPNSVYDNEAGSVVSSSFSERGSYA